MNRCVGFDYQKSKWNMRTETISFRAYRDPKKRNLCAERIGNCVERWVQTEGYAVTDGPAEPFGAPQNLILPSEAPAIQRQLREHEPLYLWRYPLAFRLQLWRQGWDFVVRQGILHTGTPGGALELRQKLLYSALDDLIVATHPRLLIGPLDNQAPPGHLSAALRELSAWQLRYLEPAIAEETPSARLLQPGQRAILHALSTGGLLIQLLA